MGMQKKADIGRLLGQQPGPPTESQTDHDPRLPHWTRSRHMCWLFIGTVRSETTPPPPNHETNRTGKSSPSQTLQCSAEGATLPSIPQNRPAVASIAPVQTTNSSSGGGGIDMEAGLQARRPVTYSNCYNGSQPPCEWSLILCRRSHCKNTKGSGPGDKSNGTLRVPRGFGNSGTYTTSPDRHQIATLGGYRKQTQEEQCQDNRATGSHSK